MSLYYTKQNLYREIDHFRAYIGLPENTFPIHISKHLEQQEGIKIQAVSFSTRALRGMVSFGENNQCDIILLNSHRSAIEQNFDCAHEAVHLGLHRNEHKVSFTCIDQIPNKQDSFLEWHANEGAAELLVPYRDFIPRFAQELQSFCKDPYPEVDVRDKLAAFYQVSYKVIENRIENLNYEIDQYFKGIDTDHLRILSRKQQSKHGIVSPSYNVICNTASFESMKSSG